MSWTELPNDPALNSRCVLISMTETQRTDLKKASDSEIIKVAGESTGFCNFGWLIMEHYVFHMLLVQKKYILGVEIYTRLWHCPWAMIHSFVLP